LGNVLAVVSDNINLDQESTWASVVNKRSTKKGDRVVKKAHVDTLFLIKGKKSWRKYSRSFKHQSSGVPLGLFQ